MELLRPQTINSHNSIIITLSTPIEFEDTVLGVKMTKSVTTISMGTMGVIHKPAEVALISATDPRVGSYMSMQALMNNCVNNAEQVRNYIQNICMAENGAVSEVERAELIKKDFMWLKKWFMDEIRGLKIYKHFKYYNSTKKLKDFSRVFNNFILDRNKYTHGLMCFVSPDFSFAIEYVDENTKKKAYARVIPDVFKSYNDVYKQILAFIGEYQTVRQNIRTGKIENEK